VRRSNQQLGQQSGHYPLGMRSELR